MEEQPAFTPRNVAKHVVKALVQIKVTKFAANAVSDYTSYDSDDTVVQIGAGIFGWAVADKLKPHTDRAVDIVADKIEAYREKKQPQENTSVQ